VKRGSPRSPTSRVIGRARPEIFTTETQRHGERPDRKYSPRRHRDTEKGQTGNIHHGDTETRRKARALTTEDTEEHGVNSNSRGRLFHTSVDGDKLSVSPQGCTSEVYAKLGWLGSDGMKPGDARGSPTPPRSHDIARDRKEQDLTTDAR
jgi:hypothetical protein